MERDFRTRAPIENLVRRAELARELRSFFDRRGFVEVQTPILSRSCVIDRHLDPIRVEGQEVLGASCIDTWFMQTSPEQSMKRLLASGIGSIYQLGPVFRSAEAGSIHNPEFTMAEWYEVDADFERGLATIDALCQNLLGTEQATRVAFADAWRTHTGIDLWAADQHQLASLSLQRGWVHSPTWSSDWDDWVNLIFSFAVQPNLGWKTPVLLTHFPASQAALARLDPAEPRTALRFELFYRGVELANGYDELVETNEVEARAIAANAERVAHGNYPLPTENPLLGAIRHGLPASCGCALGFDRLVMLACNAQRLDEVMAFPADLA
ncbi:MAG: EF-P lysine aminoacylase EpmA [Planctomycetota bacterium]